MSEPIANIARHLPMMAEAHPDLAALKVPRGRKADGSIDYLSLSFRELEAEAAGWQRKMEAVGLRQGQRCLVMVRPGLPLIAAVFALFAQGAVPVIIDPGMGLRSFLKCVKRSRPTALLGIPLAQVISRLALGTFASVDKRIWASGSLEARLKPSDIPEGGRLKIANTRSQDLAAILFTSGSTGAPKGVCYEHGMFEAQVREIRAMYDIRPGEVDLPLLPVFALFNPALGMTSVIPEIDPKRPATVDPAKIVQAIRQEKVTNSFGSPTLWGIIADHCERQKLQLPTLKRVLCAGAPVPARLWTQSRQLLPGGRMHSPYGATEALPVSSVSADKIQLESLAGAHVGRPASGIEVRVVAISDGPLADGPELAPLPPGAIGEILVRGEVVTRCYDALPEATAAAKVLENDRIWHRMGDTGFLDTEGELWFCGRKVERVLTAAGPLYTEPCERVFRGHPRARRCALVGLGEKGRAEAALVVEAEPRDAAEAQALAEELGALARSQDCTRRIRRFFFRPRFPVDVRHNAKIHRLTLADWAAKARSFEARA